MGPRARLHRWLARCRHIEAPIWRASRWGRRRIRSACAVGCLLLARHGPPTPDSPRPNREAFLFEFLTQPRQYHGPSRNGGLSQNKSPADCCSSQQGTSCALLDTHRHEPRDSCLNFLLTGLLVNVPHFRLLAPISAGLPVFSRRMSPLQPLLPAIRGRILLRVSIRPNPGRIYR